MKKQLLTAFIIVFIQISAFGQYATLQIADREFEAFNFTSAVKYYQQAYESKPTPRAVKGLAESYYLMRDFQQAEYWYGQLANVDRPNSEDILKYGHTLRNNAKFREAKAQYQRVGERADRKISLDELDLLYRSCDSALVWMEKPQIAQEIQNLRSLNTNFSEFGAVSHDGNLIFSSDRKVSPLGADEIYGWTGNAYLSLYQHANGTATRSPMTWYDNQHHVGPISISPIRNEVYFSVTRQLTRREKRNSPKMATVNVEIFTNDLSRADWGVDPRPFKYNNITQWSVGDPFISLSGDTLYFVSDMPGGFGGTDIYYVVRKASGEWGDAINLGPTVNTAQDERFPAISPTGDLYFSSAGHIGMGGLDLFVLSQGANRAQNLGYPLNSPGDDFAVRFDQNYTGFLASNRVGGQGQDDIYSFNINREIKIDLRGRVLNAVSNLPVAGAMVRLVKTDAENEEITLQSQADGSFHFNLSRDASYVVSAAQTGFKTLAGSSFHTRTIDSTTTIQKDLLLEPVEKEEVVVLRNIYFDFDESAIRPDAALELSKILSFLNSDPSTRIELSAHTDSRGSEAYNMDLSQRRADAAVAFLVSGGINPNRLVARGYGFSRLANHCSPGVECSDEEHQFNRRVEFFIIKD